MTEKAAQVMLAPSPIPLVNLQNIDMSLIQERHNHAMTTGEGLTNLPR
ncbi:hypothetical protein IQ268_05445 [Oculatella sp. LEGE 06141]|nr:hypothetical protein [Oculatella sp. LEGE 06141]MBE9178029.1 hypothetical protein [Oculatella sp. LEGE 06141]